MSVLELGQGRLRYKKMMGTNLRFSEGCEGRQKSPYIRPAFAIFHADAAQAKKLTQALDGGADYECLRLVMQLQAQLQRHQSDNWGVHWGKL